MRRYRITPRAREDLLGIGRYTEKRWGREQRNRYLRNLEKRFAWLADSPCMGKHRPEVHEGYYSFPQGEHVVFYLIAGDHIDIIGVPHRRMDILSHFLSD